MTIWKIFKKSFYPTLQVGNFIPGVCKIESAFIPPSRLWFSSPQHIVSHYKIYDSFPLKAIKQCYDMCFTDQFLVTCYATLHPAMLVRW